MNKRFHFLLFFLGFIALPFAGIAQGLTTNPQVRSSNLYDLWDTEAYDPAFAADNVSWLSELEQDVYYYMNLVRMNPSLFARTYAKDFTLPAQFVKPYAWDERKVSLLRQLNNMEAAAPIAPDSKMYQLAQCFAVKSGMMGGSGHDRAGTGCKADYGAEVIQLGGPKDGLSIVMAWLIDAGEQNADLMHRKIILDPGRTRMGVAVRPHKNFGFIAVADFALQ